MIKICVYLFVCGYVGMVMAKPVTSASTAWSINSDTINGKHVVAKVLVGDLEKSPAWPNILLNPPLSVQDAIRSAELYAAEFEVKGVKLEVADVTLKKIGSFRYVYIVQIYFMPENGKSDGFSPPLNIVVLMDGKVIKFVDGSS